MSAIDLAFACQIIALDVAPIRAQLFNADQTVCMEHQACDHCPRGNPWKTSQTAATPTVSKALMSHRLWICESLGLHYPGLKQCIVQLPDILGVWQLCSSELKQAQYI